MESIVCLPCPDTTEQFKTESNENNTEIQSFKYMCPKGCGYGANLKGNYNRHLNIKTDCTPLPSGTKRCSKCNQIKNEMEFYTGNGKCKICLQIFRKKCKHSGCGKTPSFGHNGKATHCSIHKQPDMKPIRKTCKHSGCGTIPSFGHNGKATHCSIHKQPYMEHTRKTCEYPGCRTRPSFGHNRKATHCSIHKQPDMEYSKKTCEYPGCGTIPSFGHNRKARYCLIHKQPDMESTHKTCEYPDCGTIPSFGHNGNATHCSIHKQPDMKPIRKTCKHGRQRHMCPDCQGPVISKYICKICIKAVLGNRNRRQLGICAKCDADASEIMHREEIMREMIMKLVDFEPSLIDSSINGVSCKELEKRRPDFIYVLPNVVIVIEIDEESHVYYQSSCEISKVSQQNAAIQLCDGLENVDVITIRLNPDAYHIGKVSWETRVQSVADRVNELIDEYQYKFYDRTGYQRVEYFYYHEKAQHHIDAQGKLSDVMVFPQT